ncbi:hypothetical protein GCM10009560_70910 [Nonomuraea longicatena]|uniref:Uncharacterized protein n=1 Tax=Nonomuraea longicatena TaxID=83682 RepID=A0ABN1R2A7_9ACTN
MAEQLGEGFGREGHRLAFGDHYEVGQRDPDRRLPAATPGPVGFDGWDAVLGALQVLPVGRWTGRDPRGAAYDRAGFQPHRLSRSAVVDAGCRGPPTPLTGQVGTGPAVHAPAVPLALLGDQGHRPGVAGAMTILFRAPKETE